MKRSPKKPPVDLEKLDDFASAANGAPVKKASVSKKASQEPASKEAAEPEETGLLPWEAEDVNENVIKPFNLRLNQPDSLKVKFIVKNSPQYKSKHDFCMQVVQAAIEGELEKMINN
jgi:hypothetical protein